MQISKSTIEVLKNFASINSNLLVVPGKTLTTRTVAKNVFVSTNVDTEFPTEFGIYNLQSFLGVLSLFSEPEIEFGEKSLVIKQGKNKVRYNYADREVLEFPDKTIKTPTADAEFDLSEENWKSLQKAGAVLGATDLKIEGDGETITCTVIDPKNSACNTFSIEVGKSDRKFDIFVKLEYVKLLPGSYHVTLSASKPVVTFDNTNDMEYTFKVAYERETTKWY